MSLAWPKPEPRVVTKRAHQRSLAQQERACRAAVRHRDHGKCVVPGCKERSKHLHHIVYRSRSRALKWLPSNCCSLCPAHHALVHAGKITISGDANQELTIAGERQYLAFKL